MRICNYKALFRLSEYNIKSDGRKTLAGNEITKHIPRPDRRQLIGVSYQYDSCTRLYRFQKRACKAGIYHRSLVNYYDIFIEKVPLVTHKYSVFALAVLHFKKPVYRLCLAGGSLAHSLCGSSCRCGKCDLHIHAFKYTEQRPYYRSLSRTRSSGQYHDPAVKSFSYRLPLKRCVFYGASFLLSVNKTLDIIIPYFGAKTVKHDKLVCDKCLRIV